MRTLPTAKTTCNFLEQEESQSMILGQVKDDQETLAMFSKGNGGACTTCGKSQRTSGRCWSVVGYLSGYPNANKQQQKNKGKNFGGGQKWNKNKNGGVKTSANVQNSARIKAGSTNSGSRLIMQQIEALFKMLLPPLNNLPLIQMMNLIQAMQVLCFVTLLISVTNAWILDSGASDHMTGCSSMLVDVIARKN